MVVNGQGSKFVAAHGSLIRARQLSQTPDFWGALSSTKHVTSLCPASVSEAVALSWQPAQFATVVHSNLLQCITINTPIQRHIFVHSNVIMPVPVQTSHLCAHCRGDGGCGAELAAYTEKYYVGRISRPLQPVALHQHRYAYSNLASLCLSQRRSRLRR